MKELQDAIDEHGVYKIKELLALVANNNLKILNFILVMLRNTK